MIIARRRIRTHLTRRAPRRHHADLALKIERPLSNGRLPAHMLPRVSDVGSRNRSIDSDASLAASVISAAPNLQKYASTKRGDRVAQFFLTAHHAKRPYRKAVLREPSLLQRLVLDNADWLYARP